MRPTITATQFAIDWRGTLKNKYMSKLFATLETSKGKVVSISDNEQITATVYDKNLKAYSVIIEWCDVGDGAMGAIVTTREWRNQPDDRRKNKRTPEKIKEWLGNGEHDKLKEEDYIKDEQ